MGVLDLIKRLKLLKILIHFNLNIIFRDVCENFLGNHRSDDYMEKIERLVDAYKDTNALMSVKLHMLWAHPEKFPPNCGAGGDEEGERQHQVFKPLEKQYSGCPGPNMLARLCWLQIRETQPY